jgi:spore coat protein H
MTPLPISRVLSQFRRFRPWSAGATTHFPIARRTGFPAVFLLFCTTAVPAAPPLPRYELRIERRHLNDLEQNPDSNETRPATFSAYGQEYKVQVRVRGSWARSWPKKPLKIFFEKDREFEGNDCLNLNPAWRDASFVREPLAYHVYSVCGVPCSRARMVQLDVNGKFHGFYVDVEQPDKPLLKRHNLRGAAIYKANSTQNMADERNLGGEKAFAAHYEKETRKTEPPQDLQQFCRDLASAQNVTEFFLRRVDLDKYINYLAASVLVQNWDGLNKNHFLIHDDRGSGKWIVVPWDLDRTFGDHWRDGFRRADVPVLLGARRFPGPTGWNRMADRFFSEPALRTRFLTRLDQLLRTEFTTEKLFPILDSYEAQLKTGAARDRARWPGPAGDLGSGIGDVKHFIEQRRKFLAREIERLRAE